MLTTQGNPDQYWNKRITSSSKIEINDTKNQTYQLVNSDTNGSLVDIENNTSSAVVELVGHALVDGGVNLDVDIISSLYKSQ